MDEKSAQVFLPPRERCYERLSLARFGGTVTCVHCKSDAVVDRGTTGKDLSSFGVNPAKPTSTTSRTRSSGQHRFGLEEMFYVVREMRSEPTARITRDLDRDYGAVLSFVH